MDFEWTTHIIITTNKCIGESSPVYLYCSNVLCFTRPRYQVSVYRTIGPLVLFIIQIV